MSKVLSANSWPTNGHLIEDVARLGFIRREDRVLDPTFGRGTWWSRWSPSLLTGVNRNVDDPSFDFTCMPVEWTGSFDVVAGDPPYVLKGGRSTSGIKDFDDRFGLNDVPAKYSELRALIDGLTSEAHRVLADPTRVRVNGKWKQVGGLYMLKVKNFIWSSTFHPGVTDAIRHAEQVGFRQVAWFEMVRAAGPQPARTRKDGHPSVQENPVNNVSVLVLFRKQAG